jgi:hypothetical protein
VEIDGGGFQLRAAVTFGADAATNVRVVDNGTIWAATPPGVVGPVDVVVINPGGDRATLAAAYMYVSVPLPTLTASATAVAPGSQLSVSWKTLSPGPLDWIALFSVGSPNSEAASSWWRYTTGSTGTLMLTAPSQPGSYEFRYLPDDDYIDVARSAVVTVTAR